MTEPGGALLAAAMRHLGAPFRLHGRDAGTGLDCVGLVTAALAGIGRPALVPSDYSLRWADLPAMDRAAKAAGLIPARGMMRDGDVILALVGPVQFHLLIAAPQGMAIHAHAGLGRVVLSARPEDWPTIRHWRVAP